MKRVAVALREAESEDFKRERGDKHRHRALTFGTLAELGAVGVRD